ncbi:stalk domain-containing protein [Paenibacillus solisilvae]|uniref:Stalk domain-containing protein n=1 Tax=Paenibacillus solisilvae TaxID=2486751 RepID=A0ABW0W3Z1_9BACL
MNKIKLAAVIMVLAVMFAQSATAAAGYADPSTTPTFDIVLDGKKLQLSSPPFLQNGTTMVPFRTLFERLGLRVSWNAQIKQITAQNADKKITLTVGSNHATVDGKDETMPLAPVVKNNTAYITLRFAGTSSGGDVELYRGLNVVWMLSPIQSELYSAVVAGEKDKVDQLLGRGADPELLVGPVGPATFTFAEDSVEIVGLFLKHGMGINDRSADYTGYTLLHNAVYKGHIEVVKYLLASGADPAVTSESGGTSLDLAEFWREQVRFGYKDALDGSKSPTVQDYDTIIALLKKYMEK